MTDDPTDIRALESRAQAEDDAARLRAEQLGADLTWIMSSERGRRFMWFLLEATGVFRLSYASGDPHGTAFREGCRNVGIVVRDMILQNCDMWYSQMEREAKK